MKQISEALPPGRCRGPGAAGPGSGRRRRCQGIVGQAQICCWSKRLPRELPGPNSWEDLFQVGCIGLLKASDDFDLSRDASFSTYAVPRIVGEIRMYLRDNNLLKVSRDLLRTSALVKNAGNSWSRNTGGSPPSARWPPPSQSGRRGSGGGGNCRSCAGGSGAGARRRDHGRGAGCFKGNDWPPGNTGKTGHCPALFFRDLSQTEVARKLGISQGHVSRIERVCAGQTEGGHGVRPGLAGINLPRPGISIYRQT